MLEKNKSYIGLFWLPGNEEVKGFGTFIFKDNNEIELQIFDTSKFNCLVESNGIQNIDIILGVAEGLGEVTLVNSFISSRSYRNFRKDTYWEDLVLKPGYAYIGKHFNSKNICFSKMDVNFTCIEDWIKPIPYQLKTEEGETTLSFAPINEEWNTDIYFRDTKFSLGINICIEGKFLHSKSYKMDQQIFFSIETVDKKEIDWYQEIIRILQRFFTFFIGVPVYIAAVRPYTDIRISDKETIYNTICLFSNAFESGIKTFEFINVLASYDSIKDNINVYINNWFSNYEKLRPAFDLFLANYYFKDIYLEQKFLSLMQVLEVLHSRLYQNKRLNTQSQFKGKKRSIKEEPFLWERIEYLIDHYWRDCLEHFFERKVIDEALIVKAVFCRHYLTHYNLEKEKWKDQIFKNDDGFYTYLMRANRALKLLASIIFLSEIGIYRKSIYELIKNNVEFQDINNCLNEKP